MLFCHFGKTQTKLKLKLKLMLKHYSIILRTMKLLTDFQKAIPILPVKGKLNHPTESVHPNWQKYDTNAYLIRNHDSTIWLIPKISIFIEIFVHENGQLSNIRWIYVKSDVQIREGANKTKGLFTVSVSVSVCVILLWCLASFNVNSTIEVNCTHLLASLHTLTLTLTVNGP